MKRINDSNIKNNKPLKYSTISGGTTNNSNTTTKNKRNSVLGNLFSSNSTYSSRNSIVIGEKVGEIERNDEEMKDLNEISDNLLMSNRWNVSIIDNKDTYRRNKMNNERSLILYVSTPTTSLTLTRTHSSLIELDKLLRKNVPTLLPSRELLQSPQLLNSSATTATIIPTTTTTPKKRSSVLETISRTLSPRRSPSSNSISNISSLKSSPSSTSIKGKEVLDSSKLGRYMTELCNDEVVRNQREFKKFMRVEKDDLISVRNVERRIRKARSVELLGGSGGSISTAVLAGEGRKEASDDSMSSQLDQNSIVDEKVEARSIVNSSTAAALRLTLYPPTDSLDNLLSSPDSLQSNRRELSEATTIGGSSMDTSTNSSRPQSDVFMEENDTRSNRRSSTLFSNQIEEKEKEKKDKKGKKNKRKMGIEDFECMRVLGKGCAGKVLLVREKRNGELFALKAIHKTHVLAHRELAHTLTEQSVLRHSSSLPSASPFIVRLHYSFHDSSTLYLLLDFHPGGDLATQLARWGRLGRDRARFYMSEICTGLKGLHEMGVIYRDLKPENVLISGEGHIVLTDFGLSKDFGHYHSNKSSTSSSTRPHWLNQNDRSISTPVNSSWSDLRRETTSTFCGTAEYLAPEVLLGEPYSYEVDAWSLGTMLYEMLSGVTPFWSEDHAQMYHKVLHTDLVFETSTLIFDSDTKSLLRGLLQKNPLLRMTDQRILKHPYFSMIDWSHVAHKRYVPPYIPSLNLADPTDLSQFDETFLNMNPGVGEEIEEASGEKDMTEDIEGGPEEGRDEDGRDVFDGYSFYGQGTEESEVGEEEGVDKEDDKMIESVVLDELRTESALSRPTSASSQGDSNLDHTFTSISPSPTFDTLPTTIHESPLQLNRTPIKPIKSLDTLSETEIFSSPTTQPTIVLDAVTELEVSDDDDWDHFDNVDGDDDVSLASTGVIKIRGESKNGGKAASLWARGVTDRYKLLIISPRNSSNLTPSSSRPSLLKLGRRASQSNNSSKVLTPSTTPEPTSPQVLQQSNNRKSLRRLASNRSAASSRSHQLNSKKSKTDLMGEDTSPSMGEENLDLKGAKSSSLVREGSQRRVAGGIQRLALSAFRSKSP